MKRQFVDYHVHTAFSDDSTYEMEDVIKDAIRFGLSEICFTDHVDYGIKRDHYSGPGIGYRGGKLLANVDYPLYIQTIREMQYLYGNQISIKFGLEFGVQRHTIPCYEKLYTTYPLDFVILSVHQIENKEFWNQAYQEGRTQKEYNEQYYRELLALVKQYKHYSVLGHLDLIVRYDGQGVYPYEKVKQIIEEILKQVIADGKGIEVNTSGYRYGLSDLMPSRNILQLYKELGGSIITIGSDSHKPQDLGFHINETHEELKKLGFNQYCTFDRMEPCFHSL